MDYLNMGTKIGEILIILFCLWVGYKFITDKDKPSTD